MRHAETQRESFGLFFLMAPCFGHLFATILDMISRQQLEETIASLTQANAALQAESEALRATSESTQSEQMALNSQYIALAQTINHTITDRDALKQKVLELEAVNKRLTDMLWGRRSERRVDISMSPLLDFGDDAQGPSEASSEASLPEIITAQKAAQAAYDQAKFDQLAARRKARKESKTSREEFPAHFERRDRVLDLPEDQKVGLKLFSTKVTERLRFEKPTVYVERITRHEYVKADASDSRVHSLPPLPSIVEGCKYDFSIIAAVVGMKFAFHMPTYREEDFFGQSGWRPSRSTCNDLINYAVNCIDPLWVQAWQRVQEQPIMLGDATELTVLLREAVSQDDQQSLDKRYKNRHRELESRLRAKRSTSAAAKPQKTGSAKSFAWLYSGLDSAAELLPAEDVDRLVHPPPSESPPNFDEPRWRYAPYNIFHWSLTQKNLVIDSHLADFAGIFVGDAAGVNANLAARSGNRIAHQSCNTHARREFVKAQSNDPVLASQMVAFFRQLYAVEYRGALLTTLERQELRLRDAVPIWQRMARWLEQDEVRRLLPKSDIGHAVGYLRNQWSALQLYLQDGRLPLDNNHSERVIRPLTIGRKNWMFLGSVEAAPGRMKLFSIISSAQRHCLSIQDYLEDILLQLSQAAQKSPRDLALGSPLLMSLLPDRWAATHPQHVHHERLREKQLVAENKLYYRLQAGLTDSHPYAAAASHTLPTT
jgi:hypothetical protein